VLAALIIKMISGSGDERRARRWSCADVADSDAEKCEEPYESFKMISKKALADYARAELKFLDFLCSADVWSEEQVRYPPPRGASLDARTR
jgi:hypothetical protein